MLFTFSVLCSLTISVSRSSFISSTTPGANRWRKTNLVAVWLHRTLSDEQNWFAHRMFEAIIHAQHNSTNRNAFQWQTVEKLYQGVLVLISISSVTLTSLWKRRNVIYLEMINLPFIFRVNTIHSRSNPNCSHSRHAITNDRLGFRYCSLKEL